MWQFAFSKDGTNNTPISYALPTISLCYSSHQAVGSVSIALENGVLLWLFWLIKCAGKTSWGFPAHCKNQTALKHSCCEESQIRPCWELVWRCHEIHRKKKEREIPGQFQDVSAPLFQLHPLCSCNYMRDPEPEWPRKVFLKSWCIATMRVNKIIILLLSH